MEKIFKIKGKNDPYEVELEFNTYEEVNKALQAMNIWKDLSNVEVTKEGIVFEVINLVALYNYLIKTDKLYKKIKEDIRTVADNYAKRFPSMVARMLLEDLLEQETKNATCGASYAK